MQNTSTPSFTEFNPLPKQLEIIRHVKRGIDYSKGTHEILLSGSVGSAKSIVVAHLAVIHCLEFNNAKFGIGRLALPDLKGTLCLKIKEHLFNTGVDFRYSETTGDFTFSNGSKIEAVSWADANLTKLGSYEFSAFGIEELTENKSGKFYDVILQRTGRLPHIPEKFVISATNPASPKSWGYKKLIESKSERVRVFYSNTFENPHLPKSYVESLIDRLDPKMARRMVWGEWVEIDEERVYYAYKSENNYRAREYNINYQHPVRLHFDFNIGQGKPLSAVISQHLPVHGDDMGEWHFFDESIVQGQRTLDCMEEIAGKDIFELPVEFIVHGDASGRNRDTRGIVSDYDLIEKFLANYQTKDGRKLRFKISVPRSNPPLRERHNVSNGYMESATGKVRLFVYEKAKTLDEGFRLTSLKKGGQYVEDDGPLSPFQHCTTAATYGILDEWASIESKRNSGVFSFRG